MAAQARRTVEMGDGTGDELFGDGYGESAGLGDGEGEGENVDRKSGDSGDMRR